MKTNQYLIDFYNSYDEEGRLETKYGTVEFLTTMRYIDWLLKYHFAVCEREDLVGVTSHSLDIFRK